MKTELTSNWSVLQDVHDTAEELGLFAGLEHTDVGHQLSEWEPIDRLEHLQVLFAEHPYWGRELRYFNQAPWWYRNEFEMPTPASGSRTGIRFSNVDYFCKVWLNGVYLGEHEGYSVPFEFDITDAIAAGVNRLVIKVWSPWDTTVHGEALERRTFQVERNLVKGTYEHDDTLIARDVNPVGIYGSVTVTSTVGARFAVPPRVTYDLDDDLRGAKVTVAGTIVNASPTGSALVKLELRDPVTERLVASGSREVAVTDGSADFAAGLDADEIELWNTWDRGPQTTYDLRISIDGGEATSRRLGFRQVELIRDQEQTLYRVNGRPLYVRGTSYFPDVYVSRMHRERYQRDLHAIRSAGFNVVRVHVHVEKQEFYDLCDELGIAVIQDSEYNWTHPIDAEWARRLTAIYEQTILLLDDHPAIISWICLNEPGVMDPGGRTVGYAMQTSPGPQLYAAVTGLDPSRPAIKGSFCFDDLESGDSHNYTGSLEGAEVPYTAIDGTTEKLNTEFGFDAPGAVENLRTTGRLFDRLKPLVPKIAELQEYQYRLHKYYIEHYRVQKYRPNAGYVQFMFIDLSPQSFYGTYDWWGTPKRVVDALLESNQPVAVIIEQSARASEAVWLINDTMEDLGALTVTWHVVDESDATAASGSCTVQCGPDSSVRVADLDLVATDGRLHAVVTAVDSGGRVVASNQYRDMFDHPAHPGGHPTRMSHEFGVRLYTA
jgi:beta-mannosidase